MNPWITPSRRSRARVAATALCALLAACASKDETKPAPAATSRLAAASASRGAATHAEPGKAATAPADTWKVFDSSEGRYSLSFPGAPQAKPQEKTELDNHVMEYVRDVKGPGDIFVVMYTGSYLSDPRMALNRRAEDLKAANKKHKFVSETEIQLDGKYPGRALRWEATEEGVTAPDELRVYAYGARIFVLRAVSADDTARKKFFDSFKVTGTPPSPADEWTKYTSPTHHFTTMFPGTATADTAMTVTFEDDAKGPGDLFLVRTLENVNATNPKQALEGIAAIAIKQAKNGKVVSKSDIKLADRYPGLALRIDMTEDGVTVPREERLYIVGTRAFQVQATTPDDAARKRFLDAFAPTQ